MTVLGIDTSHHNTLPNFATLAANGIGFVISKASEGVGWKDPQFDASRAGAEGASQIFGGYHFARFGDAQAEANYFLSAATPRAGELVALDLEAAIPPGVDPVAWALAFSQVVKAAVGVPPLGYLNQSWLAAHDWSPLLAIGDGLWLPKYDGQPTGGPTGPWPFLAFKQFTDAAVIPGQPGGVDEDAFQGTLEQLKRYAIPAPITPPPPPPAPAPPPAPTFDVRAWRIVEGQSSPHVQNLQAWLNRMYPAYSHIGPLSEHYGPQTVAVLREFQARVGIKGGDGTNIGPQTAQALYSAGFRG